jgi:transcriptional regulator with XRE-family HTH domain
MPHHKNLEDSINWELCQSVGKQRIWHAYYGKGGVSLCEKALKRVLPTHENLCSICPTCMRLSKFRRSGVGVLLYFRMIKGWYVNTLAREADMDPSFLSRVEHGGRKPSRMAITSIARALKLNHEETCELLIAFGYVPKSLQERIWSHALEEVSNLQVTYSPAQVRVVEDQILNLINYYRQYPEAFPDEPTTKPGRAKEPPTQDEAPDPGEPPGAPERLFQAPSKFQDPWNYASGVSRGLPGRVEAL